jgi:RES domain
VAIYGVLYTSNTVETAVLEVFGDQWAEFHEIDSADLALFDVCELLVTSPLKVVNATGRHLNRLGTDSGFFASTDYSKTQAWARSFMMHHQTPQGIRYNSRKNPTRSRPPGLRFSSKTTEVLRPLIRLPLANPLARRRSRSNRRPTDS